MSCSRVLEPGIERSFAYRSAAVAALTPIRLATETDWQGLENLPEGGCLVAANHISYADPFAVAQMLYDTGRSPFFLAKDSLFRLPLLGRWLGATGQVPVYRGTGRAISAYTDAVAAIRAGKMIVVMPESTITRDPDLWPMRAKTGAVRIALATGCPLVPLGQWGAQDLIAPGSRRPRPWPRKTMRIKVGAPVDLSDLAGGTVDRDDLVAASDRLMQAITGLVADLRGEEPPEERWDRALGRRVPVHTDHPDHPEHPDRRDEPQEHP
ncbi:lysophospholipid acyltransferase family protein [Mobilicoccus massiliensis]|uniref:lysophospholipid acyltransferase family protein n=1 Tax=Mobilicoccus massiliensis TaxID=1522310 RepID=UPI000693AE32|nr:lysophospholipid acyltransferase family protein [Mobilicoccus massiliensis]